MTASVWRIAVEAPSYAANDLSGAGAKISGGRWNNAGIAMLYASASIALAALETLSYIRAGSLPFNRFLVRIDIPDAIWQARLLPPSLPGGWDAIPCGCTGRAFGDAWIAGRASALLLVPSVLIPDEQNILLNPGHPDMAHIVATTVKRWACDPRFF